MVRTDNLSKRSFDDIQLDKSYDNIKSALVAFTYRHSEKFTCFPSNKTKRIIPMAMANGFFTEDGIKAIKKFHKYFYGSGKDDMALCEFVLQKKTSWNDKKLNKTHLFIEIGDNGLCKKRNRKIEDAVITQLGGRVIDVSQLRDSDFGTGKIFPSNSTDLFLLRFPRRTSYELAKKVLGEYWDFYTSRESYQMAG